MFESLKILNKAFEFIKEEEKKINYEYEPHCIKEDNNWKRHLFFFELKKDFIKDVTEFSFCPYIQKPCQEQRKDKSIMKFIKADKFARTDYIKNLYKKIPLNANNKRQRNISPERRQSFRFTKNKSMKELSYNNSKINNRNNFLSNIYNKINKGKKELNSLKLIRKNHSNKIIENFIDKKATNKCEEGQMEVESFIYEPEKSRLRFNAQYRPYKDNIDRYNSKDDSLFDNNKNDLLNDNKSNLFNLNNVEAKKSGWKLTTGMESAKLFRKLKTGFIFNKNILNNNNNKNSNSIERKKNKANYRNNENNIKNNINILNILRNNPELKKRNEEYLQKLSKKGKQKTNDKNYKLFNHVRKLKNESIN